MLTPKPYYEFFCPVKIIAGHAALENIPFELHSLGAKNVLIITDKGVRANKLLDPVEAAFEGTDASIKVIFDDVPPDSSLTAVRDAARCYRDNGCDAIIAIGGGSVIDTAKAANILVSEGGEDLTQYSGAHNLPRPLKPFFVIPTTSGTGSETTIAAMVSDTEKNIKMPFASYHLLPNATILDPRMTLTLPPHLTAMTAMDAMTHAVESYTCLAANPISSAYATAAIKLISENIFKVLENPQDAYARLELAQASTMAGIAFSNAMVGLVHSIGHSVGAIAHLPHGLCMNLFLPYVLEYNKDVNSERIADLLLPLAGAEVYAQTPAQQRADKAIQTIRDMRDKIYEKTKLPRTLQETGKVRKDQLKDIATLAINDGSIIFNPKEATVEDILGVLEKAW